MSTNKILFSIFALVLITGCAETDSEKVEFTFIPDNPQVRTVDGKVQTGMDTTTGLATYETISAPWFKFKMTVSNGSAKNLVVDSLKLTMTALSSTAGTVTATSEFSADSYKGPASVVGTLTSIVEVGPGGTSPETLDLYVSGLVDGIKVYNVEVLAEGWFGTIDNPGAKFSQKYYFTTN